MGRNIFGESRNKLEKKKVIMISFASARQVEGGTTRQINSQLLTKRAHCNANKNCVVKLLRSKPREALLSLPSFHYLYQNLPFSQ